jgi:hypothetical protein
MDANRKIDVEARQVQRPGFRDIGELILKLILILLIIAWFIANFIQGRELDLFTLIILLLLLALIIWLIFRQRHVVLLRCDLTAPGGCVQGDTNIVPGRILEPVAGSAHGLGFSHYLLEVRDPANNLLSNVVIYPDSASSPDLAATQGNFAVTGGTLGWIDVEKAAADAGIVLLTSTTFTVTLRVFGVDNSELSPPCQITFNLSVNEVYIKRVSTLWSVDFPDPNEPLRHDDDTAADLGTAGGNWYVRGAANVYGCIGENIQEYTIWAIPDSAFTFAQPPPFTPVSPGPDWIQLAHIEFNAQTIDSTSFTADDVRAHNVLDGDPQPDILTNVWGTRNECICVLVDLTLSCSCWKVPALKPKAVNSHTFPKLSPSYHDSGTGKFTLLLQVIDTNGNQFYDVQRAWVDNEPVMAQIAGIGGLPACTDLYTQDENAVFKMVDIEGIGWDALIDPADTTSPTSDNFDHYDVSIQKQGAAGESALHSSTSTVPAARTKPVAAGVLTNWNLESLNAPTNPMGWPADQLLEPGESCTYDIILRVWDKTVVNEGTVHYSGKITFPIKIINSPEP